MDVVTTDYLKDIVKDLDLNVDASDAQGIMDSVKGVNDDDKKEEEKKEDGDEKKDDDKKDGDSAAK